MNVSKPHPNILIRTSVTIDLSAEQWALKTDEFPRTIIEKVADILNKRVTLTFNKGEKAEALQQGYESLKSGFAIYLTQETDRVFKEVSNTIYS